jgi:hypothetical protein
MKTRRFVSGSSLVLAGWLVATFLYDVPAKSYPKLDNKTTARVYKDGKIKNTASLHSKIGLPPKL